MEKLIMECVDDNKYKDNNGLTWVPVQPIHPTLCRVDNPEITITDYEFTDNTSAIDDDDWIWHRPDYREFKSIYYNPDSDAGGQFVESYWDYDSIIEAYEAYKQCKCDITEALDYLCGPGRTYLIDRGTIDFEDYNKEYQEINDTNKPDFIGLTFENLGKMYQIAIQHKN
jgi:hypothetical protein